MYLDRRALGCQRLFDFGEGGFIGVILPRLDPVNGFLPQARTPGQFRLGPSGTVPCGDDPPGQQRAAMGDGWMVPILCTAQRFLTTDYSDERG